MVSRVSGFHPPALTEGQHDELKGHIALAVSEALAPIIGRLDALLDKINAPAKEDIADNNPGH